MTLFAYFMLGWGMVIVFYCSLLYYYVYELTSLMQDLICAEMGKKKVVLTSKAQLRQALLLHASSKIGEMSRPLVLEKGLGQPSQPAMLRPISQVDPINPPPEAESSKGSGRLTQCKRQ